MSKANDLRISIFKKYGFMIDAPIKALNKIESLPSINNNITFNKWKKIVFGSSEVDVFVYEIFEPAPLTRISTLKKNSGLNIFKSILRYFSNKNELEIEKLTEKCISNISEEYERKYEKFDKKILSDIISTIGDELEQPVKDFIMRNYETKNNHIDASDMLTDLIILHNNTVKRLRENTNVVDKTQSANNA